MKKIIFIILIISNLSSYCQSERFIDDFDFQKHSTELNRIAQPAQYFDKIGMKSAIMGSEDGSFELWIWPWKVLRKFELSFFLENSTVPIHARDIVQQIRVTPELTTFYYSYESFSVQAHVFIPFNKQGVIMLLDVYTTKPLRIVPGFIPVIQPQWPAGAGGQYSYWDDGRKAFVFGASGNKISFLCGSPAGEGMSNPPAHMLSDNPLQFSISIKPGETNGQFIPVIFAGGIGNTRDSVNNLYKELIGKVHSLYDSNVSYYQNLKNETISVITPDNRLNLAFEFGKVALRNLMVENPTLGTGLVAGYGVSGTSGRPGFAWYFGGDAFINLLSFNGYGDFNTAKQALLFTQKWQRQDNFPIRKKVPDAINAEIGKMAHELSQSDGIVDWWNNFGYGYNHADTSPWYLVAIFDYVRQSGDVDFLKASWQSILQAFNWCISKDSNNDGLMDLKGAGLGVLEFGAFVNIHNDNYTQGLWTKALKDIIPISGLMQDKETVEKAQSLYNKAILNLDKIYWMENLKFYAYGANEKGEQVTEKTPSTACTMMFGLLDPFKSSLTVESYGTADLTTDWGIRYLSNQSAYYSPDNYNYGAIWSFASLFAGTAQYKYNYELPAFATLMKTAGHMFEYGLGVSPEVFSGDVNNKLAEAYHNQGFSVSGFMVPMIKGLAGLETDALDNKITFSPQLPAHWDNFEVRNIKVNNNKVDLVVTRNGNDMRLTVKNVGKSDVNIDFTPVLPPQTEVQLAYLNEKPYRIENETTARAVKPGLRFMATEGNSEIRLEMKRSVEIYWTPQEYYPGMTNQGLKIISQTYENRKLKLKVEGLSGMNYEVGLINPEKISKITGASVSGNRLLISVPKTNSSGFTGLDIQMEVKE